MDRIKELLELEGIQATEEQIKAIITSRNFNLDVLDDEQAVQIVRDIKASKNSLVVAQNKKPTTTAKGGKPSQRGRTKALKNQVDEDGFNESIAHLAHIAKEEIDVVTNELQTGADAWKEQTKQDWKEIILNTPVDAMNEMLEEVREEAADINSFRTAAQSAVKNIFPLRPAS